MPAWMKAVDSVTPVRAAAIGFLLTCVNPKTLLLIIGGAAAAARTGTSASVLVVTWAVFVLIGSIGVATPVIIYFALGVRLRPSCGSSRCGWSGTTPPSSRCSV